MTGGSIQLMTGMNESKYQRTWLLICSVTKKYPVIGTLERVAEDTRWGSGVVIGSCIIDILFVFALCSYISYKSWRVEVFIYHACNQEDGKLVGTELIEWFLFWWVYVRCIMRSRYIYMQPKHVSLFVLFRASYYNTPSDYFFCQEKKKRNIQWLLVNLGVKVIRRWRRKYLVIFRHSSYSEWKSMSHVRWKSSTN